MTSIWQQSYLIRGQGLGLSSLIAALPTLLLLFLLAVWRQPAWKVALAGLAATLLLTLAAVKLHRRGTDGYSQFALRHRRASRVTAFLEFPQGFVRGPLGFGPSLIAASNSAGGVMGKMISLQTIATAAAATGLSVPDQAQLFRFTLKHSVFLASVVGLEVLFFAYVLHMQ